MVSDTVSVCKNHASRPTRVRCSACGGPICTRCMKPAAVGIKCPQCARPARRARRPVPVGRHLLAAALGAGTAVFLGAVTFGVGIPFAAVLLPLLAGVAVGEVVSLAARRNRSGSFVAIAAACAGAGIPLGNVVAGLPAALVASTAYSAVLAAIAAGIWTGK